MESFLHTLKVEPVHRERFASREEARREHDAAHGARAAREPRHLEPRAARQPHERELGRETELEAFAPVVGPCLG